MPTVDETVIKISADTSELESETQKGGRLIDKFIRDTQRRASMLNRIKMSPSVTLIDRVTGPAKRIESALNRIGSAARRVTGAFTSPLGLLGAGVGVYGLGKATIGAAMTWETQAVAMEHWLNGNKQLAQEVTSWLEKFAAATPFEMEDLFPAMSRAIGITEGDVKLSERMVKLAADMAGLTPGKTVRDAMEALADAQMGEFERLKEFQMKMTKEEMEKLGGFMGFLAAAESKFAGGAEKLSQTAVGRISTITDTIKTIFRSAGMGMLEAINPELKKMTDWLNNGGQAAKELEKGFVGWASTDDKILSLNRAVEEGVIGWAKIADKTALSENKLEKLQIRLRNLGKEAATFVVDKLKSVINWIDELNNNPQFQRLSFGGKILFAFDDLTKRFKGWLDSGGQEQLNNISTTIMDVIASGIEAAAPRLAKAAIVVGKAIGSAIISGFGEALQKDPIGAMILGAIPGVLAGNPVIAGAGALASLGTWAITNLAEKARESSEKTTDISFFHSPDIGISDKIVPRAMGGIITHPQLSLVGEAGPEAIIPLSSRMRSRAMELWEQTGRYFGVRQYEVGGFAGPVPAVAHVGPVGGGINLFLGDTYVHINDLRELDEDALALRIGRKIVYNVKKAIENRI